jgi:hypothetical protein
MADESAIPEALRYDAIEKAAPCWTPGLKALVWAWAIAFFPRSTMWPCLKGPITK